MNELALFAGGGGGLLGSRLLGWRTICYVERDSYCQKVIQARIKDGFLDDAPIWDDVKTFDGCPWIGLVDVVTAGFPCQPFSGAGKQLGEHDERNLWPDTIRIIRQVRPRFALLENVSRLVSNPYFGRIIGDLAESGYDARWDCIPASAIGAPHQRDRLWIVAHAMRDGWESGRRPKGNLPNKNGQAKRNKQDRDRWVNRLGTLGETIPDTDKDQQQLHQSSEQDKIPIGANFCGSGQDVADANGGGFEKRTQLDSEPKDDPADRRTCSDQVPDSDRERQQEQWGTFPTAESGAGVLFDFEPGDWWKVEPALGRVADGVAHRVDRLRAIGNGQVPAVVRAAWILLAT